MLRITLITDAGSVTLLTTAYQLTCIFTMPVLPVTDCIDIGKSNVIQDDKVTDFLFYLKNDRDTEVQLE